MSISSRERAVIGVGAAIALAVLFMKYGRGESAAATGTLAGSFQRIDEYAAAGANVKKLADDLKVTLPVGSPGEQELAMRQQIAQAVQSNGLKLGTLRRTEAAGRRDAPFKPVQFRVELSGPFGSVANLVYALEHAPTPYLVDELNVTGGSGGSGGGGGGGSRGGGGESRPSMPSMPSMPPPPSRSEGPPPGMVIEGLPPGITLPPGIPPEALAQMAAMRSAAMSRQSASSSGSSSGSSGSSSGSSSRRPRPSPSSSSSSSSPPPQISGSFSMGDSSGPPPSMMTFGGGGGGGGGSRGGGGGGGGGEVQCTLVIKGHIYPVAKPVDGATSATATKNPTPDMKNPAMNPAMNPAAGAVMNPGQMPPDQNSGNASGRRTRSDRRGTTQTQGSDAMTSVSKNIQFRTGGTSVTVRMIQSQQNPAEQLGANKP